MIEERTPDNEMDQKIWIHLKLNQNLDSDQFLPIKIENLEDQLDQYLIDINHSISSRSTCSFGGLFENLRNATSLEDKITAINNCMHHHILSTDLLKDLHEKLDFTSDQKTLMKQIANLTKEHHHNKHDQNHEIGDLEFINQFVHTQLFASYMDEVIENNKRMVE